MALLTVTNTYFVSLINFVHMLTVLQAFSVGIVYDPVCSNAVNFGTSGAALKTRNVAEPVWTVRYTLSCFLDDEVWCGTCVYTMVLLAGDTVELVVFTFGNAFVSLIDKSFVIWAYCDTVGSVQDEAGVVGALFVAHIFVNETAPGWAIFKTLFGLVHNLSGTGRLGYTVKPPIVFLIITLVVAFELLLVVPWLFWWTEFHTHVHAVIVC